MLYKLCEYIHHLGILHQLCFLLARNIGVDDTQEYIEFTLLKIWRISNPYALQKSVQIIHCGDLPQIIPPC